MQYLLDCANAAKVAEVMEYFPIVGVTTNPTFVTREHAADGCAACRCG